MKRPVSSEVLIFGMFRKVGNNVRKLQSVRCRLRDAELEAIDLAKELGSEITLSWFDIADRRWHSFGKYFPNGTRRLHGEVFYETLEQVEHPGIGRTWIRVEEGGEA